MMQDFNSCVILCVYGFNVSSLPYGKNVQLFNRSRRDRVRRYDLVVEQHIHILYAKKGGDQRVSSVLTRREVCSPPNTLWQSDFMRTPPSYPPWN